MSFKKRKKKQLMSSLKSLFFERIDKLLTSHIAEYVTKIVV